MSNRQLTFIDWFAGIGGFRRGMELAGHKCIGFCEFDKFAVASYTSMHLITDEQRKYLSTLDLKKRQKEILKEEYRNGEWYAKDITEVRGEDVPKSDCWCFGAPCQDFSVAGKRAGLKGERSSLIREVFRILGEIPEEDRPRWLIYENVKGMLSSHRGFDFLAILLEMERWGYDIQWQLLNSKYHGVPQNRERVYTIGCLRGSSGSKIFPIERTDSENCIYGLNNENSNIKQIDQCFGTITELNPCASRIYDEDGLMRSLGSANGIKTPFISNNMDVKTLGHRKSYNNNTVIVDPTGVARTLDTAAGGGRELHTIEVVGNVNMGHEQNGRIYNSNGISPCLNGIGNGGNHEPKIEIEVVGNARTEATVYDSDRILGAEGISHIKSKRLQRADKGVATIGNTNPSGRGMNGNCYSSDGVNPALTTNKGEGNKIVVPIECVMETSPGFNQKNVVHNVGGLSRTLIGQGHCGNEPKVAIPVLTPDRGNKRQNGRRFKENGDPTFTLTGQDKHGVAIGIDDLYNNRETRLYEEEIPTLRSGRQGLKVATNNVMPEVIGGIEEKNFGKQYRQGNRIYNSDKIATSLEASPVGNVGGNSNLYAVNIEPLEISSNTVSDSLNECHTLNCNDQRKVFGAKQTRTMVGYNFIEDDDNEMFVVDKSVETRERERVNCISSREDRGLSNRNQEGTLVCIKI